MSEHPVLSKRLYRGVKGLFKRSSRRSGSARGLKVPGGSVSRRSAQAASSGPKKARVAKTDQPQRDEPNPKPLADQQTTTQKKSEPNRKQSLNIAQSPSPSAKSSKVGRFWSDLFLVRPWLLVGGLWLTSVGLIAIALVGLSNPGREMVLEPITNSIEGQPLSGPDTAAVSRLAPGDVTVRRDPAATLPGAAEQTMPTWPLLLMVVACAGGCMLMSSPKTLTNNSRRGRRRVASEQPRPVKPLAVKHRLTGGKRRGRQRRLNPQRPASQVMAFRTGQKIVRHTPSPQRPAASAKPVSFAVKREPTQVSVVPENETSPLDWKEGSLAHKLDVRQTRSINSFL